MRYNVHIAIAFCAIQKGATVVESCRDLVSRLNQ